MHFLCALIPFLFFSGPLRGLLSPLPAVLRGFGCTVHPCWVFPQAPAKAAGLSSESPGRPRGGSGAAAVPLLPSAAGFDQVLWGCMKPDLPSPASLRWKVLFSLSVASKALPPSGWDETDNGSHFAVV